MERSQFITPLLVLVTTCGYVATEELPELPKGCLSSEDQCYSAGDITGAVVGTLLVTLALLAIGYALYRMYWRGRRGKHLVLVTDPEGGVTDDYAFDNPCFRDGTPIGRGGYEKEPVKLDHKNRWSAWSPLGAIVGSRNEKRRALDDSFTGVLACLRFYAVGEYQTGIGISRFLAISQKSVSRAIIEVSAALNRIMPRWIKFPDTLEEQARVMRGFHDEFGFPGVLGVIDCTHVSIIAPQNDDRNYAEHYYVNRKGYHSINVQLTCDKDMRILHVNALHPGSCSDKFIFRDSNLKRALQRQYNNNNNMSCYLLGDSGYSLEPWMMTIDNTAQPDTPAALYNDRQKVVRCTIERCNGLLKQRFRCCLKHRVLHYHPETATQIINGCAVIHNMCIAHAIDFELDSDEEEEEVNSSSEDEEEEVEVDNHNRHVRRNPLLVAGERIRNRLIRNHFT